MRLLVTFALCIALVAGGGTFGGDALVPDFDAQLFAGQKGQRHPLPPQRAPLYCPSQGCRKAPELTAIDDGGDGVILAPKKQPVWQVSYMFGTISALSFSFSMFWFSVALAALTTLVISTTDTVDHHTSEIQFIRSIVVFFATIGVILFTSVLVLSGMPPVYFGFAQPSLYFFFYLLMGLLIMGGMIWMTVFLYFKLHKNSDHDINRCGCICGRSSKKRKVAASNNSVNSTSSKKKNSDDDESTS